MAVSACGSHPGCAGNGQCSLSEAITHGNSDSAIRPDCVTGTDADPVLLLAGMYTLTGAAGVL